MDDYKECVGFRGCEKFLITFLLELVNPSYFIWILISVS